MRNIIRTGAALLFASAFTNRSLAADNTELQALREQLRALEQQVKVLARQIEIKDEAAAAAAPTTPKITVNDRGVTLASADAANSLRLRGLVQLDHRAFFNDNGASAGLNNNGFVLRRARLITEGVFAKNYSFQLVTEFGGNAVSILDANFGITVSPALQFKLGKFKSPVGLELLQSDSWTFFNERSIATNLVPNRDLGITAGGDVLGGKVNYTVGVFNGVADGASSTNADFDNEKDFVARVFVSPFRDDAGSPLQGLAFGVGASYGREKGTAGRTGAYRTDGQQTFFSYLGSTVTDGPNWRISPQLDYRNGSFGLLGEYTVSAVNVRPGAAGAKTELKNKGWQLAAGYVLTGENSSYNGVVPATNFDYSKGTWGAFEVTGRYSNLQVDDNAFPLFASLATNANEASSVGLGLNWYLSKAVAFKLDYYQTTFDLPPGAPAISTNAVLRQYEKTFISRFQLAF
jgi:phosphate-selective porin OprO/OprP